jgi:hypothetical protein
MNAVPIHSVQHPHWLVSVPVHPVPPHPSWLLGLGELLLILAAGCVVVSLIRLPQEKRNSIKLRTVIFLLMAIPVQELLFLNAPVFLYMALRSFRAGAQAHKGAWHLTSGRFGAKPNSLSWLRGGLGVLGALATVDSSDEETLKPKYHFDGNGEPYLIPRENYLLDARDGW